MTQGGLYHFLSSYHVSEEFMREKLVSLSLGKPYEGSGGM
jgi:hypothetical protein